MSNVLVEKNKLDVLATAISNKSGEPLTLTLDEMVEAVDGIETGGGGITPTGNIDITQAGVTDVTNYATATVPSAAVVDADHSSEFYTNSGKRLWRTQYWEDYDSGGFISGVQYGNYLVKNAVAKNTTITPTESSQTIGGTNYMMEGAVTVNPIPIVSVNTQYNNYYYTANNARYWGFNGLIYSPTENGYMAVSTGGETMFSVDYNAIPSNTTITPTESAQTIGGADTMMEGAVTVSAIPSNYVGSGITQRSSSDLYSFSEEGYYWIGGDSGYYAEDFEKAVPNGTAGTPTATKGTVSNHSVSVTPSVTNTTGYITGSTINGTAVSVSASELVSGTLSVTSAGTKDVTNFASASIPSGTEGTPTATKGTVTNHSVSVTPSVTNTSGFISGGTKNGTAVTVSASELVSGSETKTENGTYDVTNLAEIVVNVQGGGGTVNIGTKTMTNSDDQANHIEFTDMEGQPRAFFLRCTSQLTRSSSYSYYYITTIRYNGTNTYGNYYRKSNGSYYNDTTHYYYGYTGTTFTLYTNSTRGSAGGSFYNGTYELVYIY